MEKLKEIWESITPILIRPGTSSLTIGISKRFFLFQAMQKLVDLMEEDPYLNFITVLKSYKILGRILTGTVGEFYRNRNKLYFKNFFYDKSLYEIVKKDIEWLYQSHKDVKVTMTKRGIIIYDNYVKNGFNILLMTIHSGTWVPDNIKRYYHVSPNSMNREIDLDTHKIYSRLVLEKGGIWIDNKQSRFVIDYNRSIERSVYDSYKITNNRSSEVWGEELAPRQYKEMFASYREFYFTLASLLNTHEFNIIFDGHSMKDLPGRANISFGTRYIPNFYMPIVKIMQKKMISLGYSSVSLNKPYGGGFILRWISTKYPNVFTFSMEVNKKLYMTKDRTKSIEQKLSRLSQDLTNIFNIERDEEQIVWPEITEKETRAAKYLSGAEKN